MRDNTFGKLEDSACRTIQCKRHCAIFSCGAFNAGVIIKMFVCVTSQNTFCN